MNTVIVIGAIAYTILGILLFIRLIKGPTAADRCMAADMIDNLICLALVFYALYSGRTIYLDIAIVTALLGFISTTFVARYLERRLE
ncbi:MAG: monovalent cation/H+ antiporter complex subunit F [Eubacteriales bacterium]|nr:monovalent cation/H+ antiporter complex subunit F [Eubacteriales bacterium]